MGIMMKWKLLAAVAVIACTVLIALILSLANNQTLKQPYTTQYGIVIDAGSNSTALFLYQWLGSKENNTGVVSQKQSCNVDGGGISSYAQNPPAAGQSLVKCLNVAKDAIPSGQWASTPAYLGATAGMRLLSLQNQNIADSILQEVSKTMKSYQFNFKEARIISGMEEGASGWITINYLMQSFITYTFGGIWIHPTAGNTVGALDLGSASTQISFIPNGSLKANDSSFNLQLYGYQYELYTHSYMCYGMDQALKKLQAYLYKTAGPSSVIDHPCYNKGYVLNVTLADLYNSPCVDKPSNFTANATVTFSGTGNSSLCFSSIENTVNLTSCALSPDCGFNGVYQPPVNGQFIAFSSYFNTFNFLGLAPKAGLAKVISTIDTHCSKNWTTLTAENPSIAKNVLKDYCASAQYIMTILLKGYKFSDVTWDQITFANRVADTNISWTLGYMLNQTNMISSASPGSATGVPHGQWAAQIFFIVLPLILCLIFIVILVFIKASPTGQ